MRFFSWTKLRETSNQTTQISQVFYSFYICHYPTWGYFCYWPFSLMSLSMALLTYPTIALATWKTLCLEVQKQCSCAICLCFIDSWNHVVLKTALSLFLFSISSYPRVSISLSVALSSPLYLFLPPPVACMCLYLPSCVPISHRGYKCSTVSHFAIYLSFIEAELTYTEKGYWDHGCAWSTWPVLAQA